MKFNGSNSPLFNLFDFDRFPPSIANLPAAMTINGTTVYPTFRYNGKDAGATIWNPWGYGEQLTLQAGTAPTYNNGSPLLGSLDDSVKFNAGGYYRTTNATGACNIGTGDFVAEIVFRMFTNKSVTGKYGAAPGKWVIGTNSSNYIQFLLINGVNNATVNSAAVTNLVIYHAIFFGDRSGSGQWYVNGVASGAAVDISAVTATLTGDHKFGIGTNDGDTGADAWTGEVYYLAVHEGTNTWLDSHLQPTIAKTRFMQLTGMYPQQARGTYLPTTFSRAGTAVIDKIESNGTSVNYTVGANWPQCCSRLDTNGKILKGYLPVTGATLTFVANDGNTASGQGTLSYDILLANANTAADGYAVTLSNAASATVNIKSGINATNDSSCLLINNTTRQATIVGTTDISSNTVKTITNTWNTNSAILQVNSTQEGTPSTTCTIPTITQIDLSDEAGANQINGLIANLKIYNTDNANKKG